MLARVWKEGLVCSSILQLVRQKHSGWPAGQADSWEWLFSQLVLFRHRCGASERTMEAEHVSAEVMVYLN